VSRERERTARADVLGVGVHAVDLEAAIRAIAAAIEDRRKGYVCLTGVHGVMEARRDAELRRILHGALLNLPDGVPTVWVGRSQGHRQMDRVFGPELMAEVCRRSVHTGWRHFLYGGAEGVAPALARRLEERFPGIRVVGFRTPPFRPLRPEEERELAEQVQRCRPDLFWVGLGTPKQERFMAHYSSQLEATLMLGVGAAFDFHTGRLRDAPVWVKRAGLQWAHRLIQEPRRLVRRYASNNSRFLLALSLQMTGLRRARLEDWNHEQP